MADDDQPPIHYQLRSPDLCHLTACGIELSPYSSLALSGDDALPHITCPDCVTKLKRYAKPETWPKNWRE